jgi:hypothetical protein
MHEPDLLVHRTLIHSAVQGKWEGSRERPSDGVTWMPAGLPVYNTTTTKTAAPWKLRKIESRQAFPVRLVSLYFVQGLLVVSNTYVACVKTGVSKIYLL